MNHEFKVGDRVLHAFSGEGTVIRGTVILEKGPSYTEVDFDNPALGKLSCYTYNLTLINTLVEKTPPPKVPDTAFWLVWSKPVRFDTRSNRTPRVTYTTAAEAEAAADTLARQFPGRKFFVMKAESSYKASGVQKTVLT